MHTYAIIGHSFIRRDIQVRPGPLQPGTSRTVREPIRDQLSRELPHCRIVQKHAGYLLSQDRYRLLNSVPHDCRAVYFVFGDNDLRYTPAHKLFKDMLAFGHEVLAHRPRLQYVGFSHLFARVDPTDDDSMFKGSQRPRGSHFCHNAQAVLYNQLAEFYSQKHPESSIKFFGSSLAAKAQFLDRPDITRLMGCPALDILGTDGVHPKLPDSGHPEPWVNAAEYASLLHRLQPKVNQDRKNLRHRTQDLMDDREAYRSMMLTPFKKFIRFVSTRD